MSNLRKWSQSASGNATVSGGVNTINFAEGQNPSTVNNSAREVMAQVRKTYKPDEWGWIEHSATASVASQTTFKLAGDQTADWVADRRWRLISGSSTRYGYVISSSYTVETTITVAVDSGSLSASHTLVALSSVYSKNMPAQGTNYVSSDSMSAAIANFITSNSVSSMMTTRLSSYVTSDSVSAALATSGSAPTVVLASTSVGTGTSYTISATSITRAYKVLQLVIKSLSHDSGSTETITVELSGDNGSTWGTAFTITRSTGTAASSLLSGTIDIYNANVTSGTRILASSLTDTSGNPNNATDLTNSITTGYIKAIRIKPSGGNFDNGTVALIGWT